MATSFSQVTTGTFLNPLLLTSTDLLANFVACLLKPARCILPPGRRQQGQRQTWETAGWGRGEAEPGTVPATAAP